MFNFRSDSSVLFPFHFFLIKYLQYKNKTFIFISIVLFFFAKQYLSFHLTQLWWNLPNIYILKSFMPPGAIFYFFSPLKLKDREKKHSDFKLDPAMQIPIIFDA
jgi:hypothetical protein